MMLQSPVGPDAVAQMGFQRISVAILVQNSRQKRDSMLFIIDYEETTNEKEIEKKLETLWLGREHSVVHGRERSVVRVH